MRHRMLCLLLRHQWRLDYNDRTHQHRRDCRRCGVSEVELSDLDLNPNYFNPLGLGLGLGA